MIGKISFYLKLILKLTKKDVVDATDYKIAYDEVAKTYHLWLSKMGGYTDQLITTSDIPADKPLKILDFACGTGYITKKLLEHSTALKITAVDQSPKMLEHLYELNSECLNVICTDGLAFLKDTTETYDIVFFGWALSYFNHHEVFPLFHKVLNPGGTLAIITNVNGTLDKIESIFLKVMAEHPQEVTKPMDIKQNLPVGKKGLINWCASYDFSILKAHEDEAIYYFDTPDELLDWLNLTGACAGTQMIFNNYDVVKPDLIQRIKKEKFNKYTYEINHKFAYGVFRKEGTSK